MLDAIESNGLPYYSIFTFRNVTDNQDRGLLTSPAPIPDHIDPCDAFGNDYIACGELLITAYGIDD
jgi:hypothetical protein